MVLEGQYLERATLITRREASGDDPGLTLEGLYHRGATPPAVVVCAPHPRLGGSMDSPVVAELAWALTRAGHATLRFNYQGVGASMGAISAAPVLLSAPDRLDLAALDAEVGDCDAAVRHLAETVPHRKILVAGYSFGAAVALRYAREHREVPGVVLVAPPTSLFDFAPIETFDRPIVVVAGQNDPLVDRAQLSGWVQAAGGRLEVLAGADHTFTRGLTDLGRTIGAWTTAQRHAPP